MVQPGIGLDTPRTNVGDHTYLTNQPEFDISQEMSFQSPTKDKNNLCDQLQNGRRGAINIRTPRSRAPLGDRKNLPGFAGGGEFTPLLKSATRNSALKFGKENGNGIPRTPAFLRAGGLENIAEDLSPVPNLGSSIYDETRNASYVNATPIPNIDSSMASTPMALLPRREGVNVLQDGNQLSLREQENVIDKIEKENFGLKLKIHFLEEALRKAGPGFSEAALKENTDLKVDKVTMQKELHRYRKTLTTAERDLELYRQQMLDLQSKAKRRNDDTDQQDEINLLGHGLEEKDREIEDLQRRLNEAELEKDQVNKFRDEVGDLEADLREKDRIIDEQEDEVEKLQAQLQERAHTISELEESEKSVKRREIELEEQSNDEIAEAKETIDELERDVKRLKSDLEEAKEDRQAALTEKDRAVSDLEELQDEMANKSVTTKGLSRQIEEKANRLQDEVEDLRETNASLKTKHDAKVHEVEALSRDLQRTTDEKDLLQVRHDSLTAESSGLQKDLFRAKAEIEDLQEKLDHEKTVSLQSEREVRDQYKGEIDRLNDELEDLRAEIRDKERLYDDDNDKWDAEKRNLRSEVERAEEKASGLQRTLQNLQDVETTLSGREFKLQAALDSEKQRHADEEAVLKRQVEELNNDVETKRGTLEEVRSEFARVKEELRLSQREQKALAEKVEGLEDEIEVLQTSLDDESEQARNDLIAAKQESDNLRQKIHALQTDLHKLESANDDLHEGSQFRVELSSRLKEIESHLAKVRKEKQELNDQLTRVNLDMQTLRTSSSDIEAERDEYKSQVQSIQQQEETFQLDQEKINLRTSKLKLESEAQRLRNESKQLAEELNATERELELEIERASEKESEYLQREASHKDVVRNLKRQISDLERRSHELEVSHLHSASPHSSASGSARKSEIIEVRHQLATAHQNLRDVRSQLKDAERDAHRKLSALKLEFESATSSWEAEKFALERDLSATLSTKEELLVKNVSNEQTITRLRSKISHLEKELQNERKNNGEDYTIALERRDLHEMLRSTQVRASELELELENRNTAVEELVSRESELRSQLARVREDRPKSQSPTELHKMLRNAQARASELEIELENRNAAVEEIVARESELRLQITRVREERSKRHSQASKAMAYAEEVEARLKIAEKAWEEERQRLSKGVRFANMSLSEHGDHSTLKVKDEKEHLKKTHVKELRGLAMQIEWLKARVKREESLRADAAWAKKYMGMQIRQYDACNKADIALLRQGGIAVPPGVYVPTVANGQKKPSFKLLAIMVRASVRMKMGAAKWRESKKIHERVMEGYEIMKKKARIEKEITEAKEEKEQVELLEKVGRSDRHRNERRASRKSIEGR